MTSLSHSTAIVRSMPQFASADVMAARAVAKTERAAVRAARAAAELAESGYKPSGLLAKPYINLKELDNPSALGDDLAILNNYAAVSTYGK